jgi:enoyl-CoA hydratase
MPLATYQLEGTTALIQMDDGKANALSEAMIAELGEALTRAEKEASAVVLAGRVDRFCAGFDLKIMMSGPEAATGLLRRGSDLLMRLYGSPLPIIAACTGHALAGGALVLLTADVRVGAAGAFRIGLNEVAIGLPVPVLAMELARDRIAPGDLGQATLRAHIYDPDGAVRVGFLDQVVPPADVVARAREEAAKLGTLSRVAYRETKKRLRGTTIAHILATLDADMAAIAGLGG